jgi:hypothetical protein
LLEGLHFREKIFQFDHERIPDPTIGLRFTSGDKPMDDPLAVYLHDHIAGSRFAIELLEKLAAEFADTPTGAIARELLGEVQADRRPLEQLVARVGKAKADFYDALGWMAERASRIKLKHDDPSGLGTFEAFEAVSLGIYGKRVLWEVLQTQQHSDPRLDGIDFKALIERAEQQYQKANNYHLELARTALTASSA